MEPNPTYVVLETSGRNWQPHGPMAVAHATLQEAEQTAFELSIKYPQRVLGVYELRSVFGTEQKVVKHKVQNPPERPKPVINAVPQEILDLRLAS